MANIPPAQIAQLARQAGFPEWDIVNVVATALAESKGDPNAAGAWHGLFQFDQNTYGAIARKYGLNPNGIYDPATNAKAAYYNWMENGGNRGMSISEMPAQWGVWANQFANHPNHAKNFVPQAQQAVRSGGDSPPAQQPQQAQQAQPQRQQAPPAPPPGTVPGVEQPFTPPYGSINDWGFDQNQGRWFDRQYLGKPYNEIPSYHLENGSWQPYRNPEPAFSRPNQQTNSPDSPMNIHSWTNPGKSPYGLGDPRNAGTGLGEKPQNVHRYGNTSQGTGRRWAQDSTGNWYGESQLYPEASDDLYGATAPPPRMANRMPQPSGLFGGGSQSGLGQFGQGAPYMAQLAAQGQRIQDQPHFQPPANMLPNGFMGFGPGRPAPPVTPMQNGQISFQGGNYSPNGLRLSLRDSGLF